MNTNVTDERLLSFSLNPRLINKSSATKWYSSGWEPYELTLDEMINAVCTLGVAFSYVFANGRRSINNFIQSDVVGVDVDAGWNMYRFAELDLVQKNCAFIYTTPSHTPHEHRFRAVFVLPRTITKSNELAAISRGLTRKLGGDENATDPARIWFGSENGEVIRIGATLSESLLEELLVDDWKPVVSSSISNSTTANRSSLRFQSTLIVTKSDGGRIRAGSVTSLTSIHCPFHHDSNPSAFISKTDKGSIFINCKSCGKTWWMKTNFDIDQPSLITDFNSFERVMEEIKTVGIDRSSFPSTEQFGFVDTKAFPLNVHLENKKYLEINKLPTGLTFIRSPKGSGKTQFLTSTIADAISPDLPNTLTDLENLFPDDDHELPRSSTVRILLIGHRQALIGDLCSRLGLNCYLEDKGKSNIEIRVRQARYGVCLDSLGKVHYSLYQEAFRYNIIVIDEAEQVLSHFLSGTVKDKSRDLFDLFGQLVSRADKVVALDADLGWTSFLTLSLLSRRTVPVKKISPKTGKSYTGFQEQLAPVTVYINRFKDTGREIELYPNISQITSAIISDVFDGKRLLITSNSMRKVKALEEAFNDEIKKRGVKKRFLVIHSEVSRTPKIQQFIKNIKKEILAYDFVITSPSLGTGVDITFENSAQEIDGVYGIFEARVNSHLEIDQQLARVRNPKYVRVWISPQVFSFETEFDVVKDDFVIDQAANSVFNLGESVSSPRKKGIPPFLLLGTLVGMQQRASRNLLRKNFVDYKKWQEWIIKEIPRDDKTMKLGREFIRLGRKLSHDKAVDLVLAAPTLDWKAMTEIEERFEEQYSDVTEGEFISLYRTRLELFYGEVVSRELIERDDSGYMKRAIIEYIGLWNRQKASDVSIAANVVSSVHAKILPFEVVKPGLLKFLLSLTPCYHDGQFDCTVKMTSDDLGEFKRAMIKHKAIIETQLDIAIGMDIKDKPMLYLRRVLEVIGLKIARVGDQTINKKKVYYYVLDQQSLDFVEMIRLRRETPGATGWRFVNRTYGFSSVPLDEVT
jgi:hypothetical protein